MTIVDSGKSTNSGDTSTTSNSTPSADDRIALSTESTSNFSKRESDIIENESKSFMLAPSKDGGKNKTVEGLTVNKLRYSSLSLHGRDKEREILNTCL
jgi:hypothetical protein